MKSRRCKLSWENWVLENEMFNPPAKRPRLRIAVSATGTSSSSTAPTVMHVDPPPRGQPLQLSIEIRHESMDQANRDTRRAEHDEHGLVQTSRLGPSSSTTATTSSSTTVAQGLLQALQPEQRGQLLRHVVRRLRVMESLLTNNVWQETDSGRDGAPLLEPVLERLSNVLLEAAVEDSRTMPSRQQDGSMPTTAVDGDLLPGPPAPGAGADTLRRPTAMAALPLPTQDAEMAVLQHLDETLEAIGDGVQQLLLANDPNMRYSILRRLVQTLVQQLICICSSESWRTGFHSPQIWQEAKPKRMLTGLPGMSAPLNSVEGLSTAPNSTSSSTPMDFDWACAGLPNLSALGIYIMSFLENGEYDLAEDNEASQPVSQLSWGSARDATMAGGAGIPTTGPEAGDAPLNEARTRESRAKSPTTRAAGKTTTGDDRVDQGKPNKIQGKTPKGKSKGSTGSKDTTKQTKSRASTKQGKEKKTTLKDYLKK